MVWLLVAFYFGASIVMSINAAYDMIYNPDFWLTEGDKQRGLKEVTPGMMTAGMVTVLLVGPVVAAVVYFARVFAVLRESMMSETKKEVWIKGDKVRAKNNHVTDFGDEDGIVVGVYGDGYCGFECPEGVLTVGFTSTSHKVTSPATDWVRV